MPAQAHCCICLCMTSCAYARLPLLHYPCKQKDCIVRQYEAPLQPVQMPPFRGSMPFKMVVTQETLCFWGFVLARRCSTHPCTLPTR